MNFERARRPRTARPETKASSPCRPTYYNGSSVSFDRLGQDDELLDVDLRSGAPPRTSTTPAHGPRAPGPGAWLQEP